MKLLLCIIVCVAAVYIGCRSDGNMNYYLEAEIVTMPAEMFIGSKHIDSTYKKIQWQALQGSIEAARVRDNGIIIIGKNFITDSSQTTDLYMLLNVGDNAKPIPTGTYHLADSSGGFLGIFYDYFAAAPLQREFAALSNHGFGVLQISSSSNTSVAGTFDVCGVYYPGKFITFSGSFRAPVTEHKVEIPQ